MAGSQAIAQGIANLGQAAGGAIREYRQKKEEEKKIGETIGFLETNFKKDPGTYAMFDDGSGNFDRDAANAAVRSVGPSGVMTFINFSQAAQANRDIKAEKQEEKRILKAVENIQAITDDVVKDMALNSSDDAVRAAYQRKVMDDQMRETQLNLARSQIAENFAQARAAGMPRSENVAVEEAQVRANIRAEEEKTGRPITAAREAAIRAAVSEGRSKNTTYDATQKDKERANLFEFLGKQRSEEINPILRADTASRRVDELLAEGNLITGKTAQAELYLKSVANDLGIGDYEEAKNTEELIALIGQQVLRNIKALGSGTAVSDADRIYTEKISGADITKQLQGIRELQNILNTQSRDSIDRFNRKVSGAFDEGDRYRNLLIVSPEDAPFMLIESRKKKEPMDATEIYDANTRTFKPIFGPSR